MTSDSAGRLRILVVPAKPWPCDHPMLEAVFAKILPARGHRVEWVMWTDRTDGVNAAWHDSLVHLTPLRTGTAVAVANRWYRLLMRMYRVARSEDFDMIQVRNSSAAGLAAVAIRRATGIPFAFQVSFRSPSGRPRQRVEATSGRRRSVGSRPVCNVRFARDWSGVRTWCSRSATVCEMSWCATEHPRTGSS